METTTTPSRMGSSTIWSRVREARLVRVLVVYVAASWVVLQVTAVLRNELQLPRWVSPVAVVLLLVGLLIVSATAWVQSRPAMRAREREAPAAWEIDLRGLVTSLARGRAPHLTWGRAIAGGFVAFSLLFGIAGLYVVLKERADTAPTTEQAVRTVGPAGRPGSEAGLVTHMASVAVLPFENLGTEEDDYFSDGVTEEIITQLAQVEGLKVISRTSVVALRGTTLTLPQIADTLGVQHILEGTVRRAGDQVRVTVQLIEAATDAHLWAQSYTRRLIDLFELQDEIAREVSRALIATVPGLRSRGPRARTETAGAYDAYLRGRHWLQRRTRDALILAIDAFETALSLDSTYAPAYTGLSVALGLWDTYGYHHELDSYSRYAKAIAMADRAISLDPDAAEAYAIRGYIRTVLWAPTDSVARDFAMALELGPNSADVHGWYAHFLHREQRLEEVLPEAERAVELDPLAPGRRLGVAGDALAVRLYDRALEETQRALVLEPELTLPRRYQALALLLLGRPAECVELALGPYAAIRAMCLHALARFQEAGSLIDSLTARIAKHAQEDRVFSDLPLLQDIVTYYAWLGDPKTALRWLERAFASSPFGLHPLIYDSGIFDRVRNDPAFRSGFERLRQAAWERVRRESRARRFGAAYPRVEDQPKFLVAGAFEAGGKGRPGAQGYAGRGADR